MSEYQYYEFRAIDKPLTRQQQEELRRLSSRAEITATQFQNEYSYGDFRGSPEQLMERYFDAFLYLANWGTRHLVFRLPKEALDRKTAEKYCHSEVASVTETREHVIVSLDLEREEADDEWLEGEGMIDELLPARAELADGDLRLLYLAWLSGIRWADDSLDDLADETEPPVPPGLNNLSDSLRAVIDFLEIDKDLVAVAAQASPPLRAPRNENIGAWVTALPEADKDEMLTLLASGQGARAEALLKRRFREASPGQAPATPARTAFQLLEAADDRILARKQAEEQRRIAAHEKRLNELVANEDKMWQQVDDLIATKKVTEYDRAVDLLRKLRGLAEHKDEIGLFDKRVANIRACHPSLYGLQRRLDTAKMPK